MTLPVFNFNLPPEHLLISGHNMEKLTLSYNRRFHRRKLQHRPSPSSAPYGFDFPDEISIASGTSFNRLAPLDPSSLALAEILNVVLVLLRFRFPLSLSGASMVSLVPKAKSVLLLFALTGAILRDPLDVLQRYSAVTNRWLHWDVSSRARRR